MALIRRRKKKVVTQEYKEFPRGGHVPDPPSHCEWRRKFEDAGKFWTETYFCGFVCEESITCEAYRNYQRKLREERKRR